MVPEATKCPFVGTNFNETILPCLFQFGRPVLFLKIQKIIKMLKLGRSRPLKVYNRNHQKNPRNKKRTIKKSWQNIIKMKKENKETPFVILTFLVFTFNINAVLTKNKKDHIKMSKRGQCSLAMINS